jgi:exonuclease III
MKIYSWNVNGIRAVHKKGFPARRMLAASAPSERTIPRSSERCRNRKG